MASGKRKASALNHLVGQVFPGRGPSGVRGRWIRITDGGGNVLETQIRQIESWNNPFQGELQLWIHLSGNSALSESGVLVFSTRIGLRTKTTGGKPVTVELLPR